MSEDKDVKDFLPLSLAAYRILMALNTKALHGYGIMKESEDESGGQIPAGTLYRNITKLLEAGLIETCDKPSHVESDDERRQYYRITPFGNDVLTAEAMRLARLVDEARRKKLIPSYGAGLVLGRVA